MKDFFCVEESPIFVLTFVRDDTIYTVKLNAILEFSEKHIGFLMSDDSWAQDLIESTLPNVCINRMHKDFGDGHTLYDPKNELVLVGAQATAFCELEYAIKPADDYTNYLITLKIDRIENGGVDGR